MRLIAFYLPQFHPIPQNDQWWGKGFTEWTNVTRAKPLFRGHKQPRLPADLGFYDLRVPEVREKQAELAREYGISAFCYWHYWFGNGKMILERPFQDVLKSGSPKFPFCLAWANQSWKGVWHGLARNKTLIEQAYPGPDDFRAHFYHLLDAFTDPRYFRVSGKPLFIIYDHWDLPNCIEFTDCWRELAVKEGLGDFYFVGITGPLFFKLSDYGLDGITSHLPSYLISCLPLTIWDRIGMKILKVDSRELRYKIFSTPLTYDYSDIVNNVIFPDSSKVNYFPSLLPNWDTTPRAGVNGIVFRNTTPELFQEGLRKCIEQVAYKPSEERIIFIKSWNEWAEGNYLEPDQEYGMRRLEVIKAELHRLPRKERV